MSSQSTYILPMYVSINCQSFEQLFLSTFRDIHPIVYASTLVSRMLVHNCICPGFSSLLTNVTSFSSICSSFSLFPPFPPFPPSRRLRLRRGNPSISREGIRNSISSHFRVPRSSLAGPFVNSSIVPLVRRLSSSLVSSMIQVTFVSIPSIPLVKVMNVPMSWRHPNTRPIM